MDVHTVVGKFADGLRDMWRHVGLIVMNHWIPTQQSCEQCNSCNVNLYSDFILLYLLKILTKFFK